ncbi:ferrous iron transport protein B [Thermogladius sp. 4427co]|uniref:ferrous iron transport protein B n=1 Tax=Thermogladius sp. 4427co TaxID=3450718 RepID=UPI003F79AB0F
MKEIVVAVAGQPNVGKSTLFNVLTGSRVLVANWPGVTVERHEGYSEYKGYRIRFVDLPGVYGLSALTIEERISRSYILSGEPDVVLVLVDSTIPERTLYLPVQILEMTGRVVIAFTKYDMAHSTGIHINTDGLEKKLGVPVVAISAVTGYGIDYLLEKIIEVASRKEEKRLNIDYGELEPFISSIEYVISKCDLRGYPTRWVSTRLLEGDEELSQLVRDRCGVEVYEEIGKIKAEASQVIKRDLSEAASSKRFDYIMSITRDTIIRTPVQKAERKTSIFYHPFIGPALSLLFTISIFFLAFIVNTGFPLNVILSSLGLEDLASLVESYSLSSLMETGLGWLMDSIRAGISNPVVASFLADGIIGGVAALLTFLPLIFIVMLILAIIEDTGLLPRMAVGISSFTSKIGLSGNALFPIAVSLGCNVPGVMASRASLSSGERIRQVLTIPFIPCQARLVVLLALATALTTISGWVMVLLGYLIAFTVFAVINYVLYVSSRSREPVPEILLEIPVLHKPIGKVVWWLTWNNVKHFIVKAGTIILLANVIVWFLTAFTPALQFTEDPSSSIAASISKALTPLVAPLGIRGESSWIIVFGLIVGFVAKELFVTSLLTVSGMPSVRDAVSVIGLTDQQLIAIGIFTVLYVPCLATLSVMYSETRSWRLVLLGIALMMSVAYFVSLLVYYLLLLI